MLLDASLRPARLRFGIVDGVHLGPIRGAIRERRKIELHYEDAKAKRTVRVVWPFLIAFMDEVRMIAAYCEQRGDFRHFRSDRIRQVRVLDEPQGEPRSSLMARWQAAFARRA